MKEKIGVFFFVVAVLLTISMPYTAHAQGVDFLDYKFGTSNPELRKKLYEILSEDVQEFQDEYGDYLPQMQIAFFDLNLDGKYEIVARFFEEYHFRDRNDNIKTYIFAQTSKGLFKIFEAMAGDLGIENSIRNDVKKIRAYRGLTAEYDVYVWDGKRQYIKE